MRSGRAFFVLGFCGWVCFRLCVLEFVLSDGKWLCEILIDFYSSMLYNAFQGIAASIHSAYFAQTETKPHPF